MEPFCDNFSNEEKPGEYCYNEAGCLTNDPLHYIISVV